MLTAEFHTLFLANILPFPTIWSTLLDMSSSMMGFFDLKKQVLIYSPFCLKRWRTNSYYTVLLLLFCHPGFTLVTGNGIVKVKLENAHDESVLVIFVFWFSDSNWHHVGITWASIDGQWAIYMDGSVRRSGTGFMTGSFIRGSGALVLGQEQDSFAGSFTQTQAFVGDLSQVQLNHIHVCGLLYNRSVMLFSCMDFQGQHFTN